MALFKNKTVVTILAVLLCILILYFDYTNTINTKLQLKSVPVAANDIPHKTEITKDMINYLDIPQVMISRKVFYSNTNDLIGKCTNYNNSIPKNGLFYNASIVDCKILPDYSIKVPMDDNSVLFNMKVDSTSMTNADLMPGSKIDVYIKGIDDNKMLFYSRYLNNVEIAVSKNSKGYNIQNYDTVKDDEKIVFIQFVLKREDFIFLTQVQSLKTGSYNIYIKPTTGETENEEGTYITNEELVELIQRPDKIVEVVEDDTSLDDF